MDPITIIIILILIAIGGTLICAGVFFIPVGGAPAAMGTSTGLATGCEMLAAGSGITGLLMTAALHIQTTPTWPAWFIVINAGISSALMLSVSFLIANVLYTTGCGIPPALATVEHDPVTKENLKPYITPGTVGHGVPTACFISGIIGGLLGGIGGGLTATVIYRVSCGCLNLSEILGVAPSLPLQVPFMALASVTAIGIYFINANIAAYSIRGVVEGWWDPKFRKSLPKTLLVCFIASIVFGVAALLVAAPIV
jgi:tetrahydromethanopterin S-methyltransferase subunit D